MRRFQDLTGFQVDGRGMDLDSLIGCAVREPGGLPIVRIIELYATLGRVKLTT